MWESNFQPRNFTGWGSEGVKLKGAPRQLKMLAALEMENAKYFHVQTWFHHHACYTNTFLVLIWASQGTAMLIHSLALKSRKEVGSGSNTHFCHPRQLVWRHRLPDTKWHCSWVCFTTFKQFNLTTSKLKRNIKKMTVRLLFFFLLLLLLLFPLSLSHIR